MFVTGGAAIAHPGHSHKIMGTVTGHHETHLMVKTTGGDELTIEINAKTKLVRAKKAAKVEDIKIGQRVVIDIGSGDDPLIAQEIVLGATSLNGTEQN
ncbi:MAG: hypothetical protein ABR606_01990 [Vicinamibacterales bacterium]